VRIFSLIDWQLIMKQKISDKIIGRLTLYHSILQDYAEKDIDIISSPQIAFLLNIDDSQVRKDLNCLNNTGKSRVGYLVKDLTHSIEKTLGISKMKNAVIIGAGNLGKALAKYDNFESYGLHVESLFDNDSKKIGLKVDEKQIYDISDLKKRVEADNIEIAILTVPWVSAQEVANIISQTDIKYIWNFTPKVLKPIEGIHILNENLMGNLLQFTHKVMD